MENIKVENNLIQEEIPMPVRIFTQTLEQLETDIAETQSRLDSLVAKRDEALKQGVKPMVEFRAEQELARAKELSEVAELESPMK